MKVIITGATGMVGEGVMHECLLSPDVEAVLVINRKPSGVTHPKLKEIIHGNFFDLSSIESQLAGYDACFFCLGVSSVRMKKDMYYRLTHTLTLQMGETLSRLNNSMTFCYVSGAGTDSTEEGRLHWARVKGKTENDLMNLPFKHVYAFRPGIIKPTKGLQHTQSFYNFFMWLFPILHALNANAFCTLQELGLAMIHVVYRGYEKPFIEVKDIIRLSK